MENIQKALAIAKKNLRACYEDGKIVAGRRHFDDYWARDAFFAIRGAKEIGDLEIVKNTLQLFFDYQQKDGQVPRKIIRHKTWLKYIFRIRRERKVYKPIYTSSIAVSSGTDQNSLFVIALKMYLRKSNDLEFIKVNYEKLKKAIFWNFGQDPDEDRLINEGFFSNWMDTIFKSGEVLYTNVLHANALSSFAEISEKLDKKSEAEHFYGLHRNLKEKINSEFWEGDHYFDWIRKRKKYNYFDTIGNLLAIYFGIADEEKATKIFDFCTKQLAKQKVKLLFTNYPKYPIYRLSPTRFFSLSLGYQNNEYEWLWIHSFYAQALNKMGKKAKALQVLGNISDVIVKYNGVYEVYNHGKPVEKLFFRSEVPFAWSAGVFIYAHSKIMKDYEKI